LENLYEKSKESCGIYVWVWDYNAISFYQHGSGIMVSAIALLLMDHAMV